MPKIEDWIASTLLGEGYGFLSEEIKLSLVQKEKRRKEILANREALWRLKRQAIWLSSGDENTKFFHGYAKGRKAQKAIWEMQDDRGIKVTDFEGLSSMGVNHFKNIFSAQQGTSIAEIVKIVGLFPHFVDDEGNDSLRKEVSALELIVTLQYLQKDKSSGPDGWPV